MLTYNLFIGEESLYFKLYKCIKDDIKCGNISAGEKMPSKRALAKNLGISTITVENAYNQLIDEGYMYSLPKKGYYVADIKDIIVDRPERYTELEIKIPASEDAVEFDFSLNRSDIDSFPFSIWARLMRETVSIKGTQLLKPCPCGGVKELRDAIAEHLRSFRGMVIDPNQIIIGAGTEYLYGLLIKLLGTESTYCLENPGYRKISQVYSSNGVNYRLVGLDEDGIMVDEIKRINGDIIHISPTHHFPTGITMPLSRRHELLNYVRESQNRYIIEDDYDSEFRLKGRPVPTLQSIDVNEKVIYMNTFSKSLSPTIRISYMILPEHLANRFYDRLSFFSCTVSTFEQYTLAEFIKRGYFEKHINRMRLHYIRKRQVVLDEIYRVMDSDICNIIENDSGLHFIMELSTEKTDKEIEDSLMKRKIRIKSISDYDMLDKDISGHRFILNYSGIDTEGLKDALYELNRVINS